jgi:threonine/homoserine/homoserine lactone efflux protein
VAGASLVTPNAIHAAGGGVIVVLTGLFDLLPFTLRGLALGFAIAAPVGPIGVLCIRRTLADGRLTGFFTGLGAATADAFYGALAAFGVSAIPLLLTSARLWIHLLGAVFIAWLGVRIMLARPSASNKYGDSAPNQEAPSNVRRGWRLASAWFTTVGLTLTNPTTILSFAAVFAGVGLASASAPVAIASATVAGVFLGSALWWLILSFGVSLARSRLTANAMRWINRVSGVTLLGFAVYALLSL